MENYLVNMKNEQYNGINLHSCIPIGQSQVFILNNSIALIRIRGERDTCRRFDLEI